MRQIERAHRYLQRLKNVYAGVEADWNCRENFEDDVYSFFMHCYHIRDWIIHLNLVGLTSSDVDNFINSHDCLKICADLANCTKHYKITRNIRICDHPHIIRVQHIETEISSKTIRPLLQSQFTLYINDETFIDALELAEQCMSCWDQFVYSLKNKSRTS